MRQALAAGIALAALAAGPATRADETITPITAADFLSLCEGNVAGPRDACSGLVQQFAEVYMLLGSKDDDMRVICPPRDFSADQARLVFVTWAEKRKDLAEMQVAAAINMALRANFPCSAPIKVTR